MKSPPPTPWRHRFSRGLRLVSLVLPLAVRNPLATAEETPADASAPAAALYAGPLAFSNTAQARIDVLIVWLPEVKALRLLPDLRDPQRIDAAQQRLLEMVASKEAHFVDWPEVSTHTGQRAVSESVIEKRYPPAFENSPAAPLHPSAPLSEAQLKADELSKLGVIIPSEFEVKNVGTTLAVEPIALPGNQAVDLQMSAQNTTFERTLDVPAGHNAKGEPRTVPQPVFRTLQVSARFALRDGERRLIYVAKPSEPAGRIYLFIAGAKIFPPGAAPAPGKPKNP